jgi:hypothetical protein
MKLDYAAYDKVKNAVTLNAFSRLKEVVGEQQRREVDPRVTSIARVLQTLIDADPQAFCGLDVWLWATRIARETNWTQ